VRVVACEEAADPRRINTAPTRRVDCFFKKELCIEPVSPLMFFYFFKKEKIVNKNTSAFIIYGMIILYLSLEIHIISKQQKLT
jgi:hypothetical protein